MGDFLPSITAVMDGLSDLMAGNDTAGEKIKEGITGIVNNISQAVPTILNAITSVGTALLEALPTLLAALVEPGRRAGARRTLRMPHLAHIRAA